MIPFPQTLEDFPKTML